MNTLRKILCAVLQRFIIVKACCGRERGRILMFHDIGEKGDEFVVTPSDFEKIATILSNEHVIPLECWESEDNFVALTFDDVPESFYAIAYPVLRKYCIPFTIFVSLSLLDKQGYISTSQLKEMSQDELCTVGSHGIRHKEYYKLSKREIEHDLRESAYLLTELIHKPITLFAFPYGSYYACGFGNRHIVSSYYKYGFGTVKCPITMPLFLPKYFLPRINVDSKYISNLSNNEKS